MDKDLTPPDKVPDRQSSANHQTFLALLVRLPDPLNHPGDKLSTGLVILRFIPQDVSILLFAGHLNDGPDDASFAILETSLIPGAVGVTRPPGRILSAIKEIKHIRQAWNSIVFVGKG